MNPATNPKETLSKTAGAILIILGFGALLFPHFFFAIIDIFLAILAIIIGISFLYDGITRNNENALTRFLLALSGIVGVCIGLSLLVALRIMTFTIKDIIGIWAIITGIGYIISVFSSVTGFDRGLKSVSGLALCFLGVVLLFAPALLTDYIVVVILGLFAIILGTLTIIFASDTPKPKKEYNHLIYK